jgi:hypothetical protein
MSSSGTFTAIDSIMAGDEEIYLFALEGNTLVQLGLSTTPGQPTRELQAAVTAGETIFTEVKGINTSFGVQTQASYELQVGLSP